MKLFSTMASLHLFIVAMTGKSLLGLGWHIRNKILTAKFSTNIIGIINSVKLFSAFYLRHNDLVSNLYTGLFLNKACRNLNVMVT